MTIHFILASQSPRRQTLLPILGYPFTAMPAHADEDSITDPNPAVNVVKTAQLKTAVIANQLAAPPPGSRTIIIAADTTVAFKEQMLNKPADAAAATDMLTTLRGRVHHVHTGAALLDVGSGQTAAGAQTSAVQMRPYTDAEIAAYVASGDPMDKAGAYAIQAADFQPVAHLDGCFTGVMGLSLCHLLTLLDRLGVPRKFNQPALAAAHADYPCPILPPPVS